MNIIEFVDRICGNATDIIRDFPRNHIFVDRIRNFIINDIPSIGKKYKVSLADSSCVLFDDMFIEHLAGEMIYNTVFSDNFDRKTVKNSIDWFLKNIPHCNETYRCLIKIDKQLFKREKQWIDFYANGKKYNSGVEYLVERIFCFIVFRYVFEYQKLMFNKQQNF